MRFQERQAVLEAARKMSAARLSPGTSGNVSARAGDWMVITPSGMPYDELSPHDLVEMSLDGQRERGEHLPSSEWRLHGAIYQARADVQAIVHAHPMFCTTLACLRRDLPAVHYMIGVSGQSVVRCAPYATFGTEELAQATIRTLGAGKACLLANHGMVAAGGSLKEALRVASEVEIVAEQYWRALQVGEPFVLGEDEMAKVIEKFQTYGKQPKRRPTG